MNEVAGVADAASRLKQARRILVVGCSGGGKTTLSRKMAARLDLPFVSMDREFFWLAGWQNRAKTEERALIAAKVAEERWLMDGTGSSSFDLRLPRAELMIWVRLPRLACMWGVVSRWMKWSGRTRPDMAPGCPERLNPEFLRYIWTFEKKVAPGILANLNRHGPHVPVFQVKNRAEMRALLDLLGGRA